MIMTILFFLYGIVIGSFLNVLIYRIPKKEEFVKSRSHCMNCGYQLRWYDLVPILSYIQLGGKCRSCRRPISIQYPLIELLNGAAYLGIWLYLGLTWWTVVTCVMFSILLVIFFIDLRHKIIPNGLVISIMVIGIVWTVYSGRYIENIIGFFSISLILLLIGILVKGGMGMGDVKMMAATGLLLGWQNNIVALMVGAILGSVIGIGLIALGVIKRKQHIPFGPFLALGVLYAMLFGNMTIQWYLSLLYY